MTGYEELLELANSEGLIVKEKPLLANKGRIYNNRIAISKFISTFTEKRCTLAEELGHHFTSFGNILDESHVVNRKQELRARAWGYEAIIPLDKIIDAHKAKCNGRLELAEYLDVTDEFLRDAIKYYLDKYGILYSVNDRYTICFDPLAVYEKF